MIQFIFGAIFGASVGFVLVALVTVSKGRR